MTRFLPAFSVLIAVITTAVPWGLPADATFILPLLVVMMVFCWRTIPGTELHPAAAAVLGLLADLLGHDVVWAAAGTWHDVFPIAPSALAAASGGWVGDLRRA